jgi:hypothetical protein
MSEPWLLQGLWLAAPVIGAGLVQVGAIKLGLLRRAAAVPLDGGTCWRGRRLFGANKSLRGLLVMAVATPILALAQAQMAFRYEWARSLTVVDFHRVHPVAWGVLLGLGHVAGELPNSFWKRQLDIAPGARAPGWRGAFFWVLDQVDSLVGALAFMCLAWVPPWPLVVALLAVTLAVHPAVGLLMFALGLKTRIG